MSMFIIKPILIFSSIALTAVIFQLIRQRKLREEYSLIWLFLGATLFLVACFGGYLTSDLVFVIGMPLLIMIILTQSVCLSKNADCIRDLAQHAALMEFRIAQLEANEASLLESQEAVAKQQTDSLTLNLFKENSRNGVNNYASVSSD